MVISLTIPGMRERTEVPEALRLSFLIPTAQYTYKTGRKGAVFMEELPVHGYVTGLFHVEILQPVTAVLKSHRTIEGLYYLLKGNIRWRPGADNRLIKEGTYQWYYLPKGKQQEIGLQPGFYLFFYFIVPPFIASEMAGAAPHVETLRQREIKLPSLKTGNKINRWVTEIISCREQQAISRNMYIVERLIGLQKWYLKITPGLQLEQQWTTLTAIPARFVCRQ
jgi:hypothetical protein